MGKSFSCSTLHHFLSSPWQTVIPVKTLPLDSVLLCIAMPSALLDESKTRHRGCGTSYPGFLNLSPQCLFYLSMPYLRVATTQTRTSLNSALPILILQPGLLHPLPVYYSHTCLLVSRPSLYSGGSVLGKPAFGHLYPYTSPLSVQPGLGQLTRASHSAHPTPPLPPSAFLMLSLLLLLWVHTQSALPSALFSLSCKSEFSKA